MSRAGLLVAVVAALAAGSASPAGAPVERVAVAGSGAAGDAFSPVLAVTLPRPTGTAVIARGASFFDARHAPAARTADQALANALHHRDWLRVVRKNVPLTHTVAGKRVGTLPATLVLARPRGGAGTEGAVAFPLCLGTWAVARIETPQRLSESRALAILAAVGLDGSLPPQRVTADAFGPFVSGHVVDCHDAPVAGAQVKLERRAGSTWRATTTGTTDADGSFTLDAGSDGTFRVVATTRAARRSAQPSVTSKPTGAVSNLSCVVTIVLADGAQMPVCETVPLTKAQPNIRRAVIVVHGLGRDADLSFDAAVDAATAAGAQVETFVIAPSFQATGGAAKGELAWGEWKWGEPSTGAGGLRARSSFEVVDELVRLLARNGGSFPNLKEIVVAGHSAGGQFVQRYAAFNDVDPPASGVRMRYVVANPSSYVYLDAQRSFDGKIVSPTAAQQAACPSWNAYGYGLDARNGYVAARSVSEVGSRYAARAVTYLLGEADTERDSVLDTACGAEYEGPNRLRRGQMFFEYLNGLFPGNRHALVTVPGAGHSIATMFSSPAGRKVLFSPLS